MGDATLYVDALVERWGEHLKPDERFVVQGEVDEDEVRVTVILANAAQTYLYPMQARMERAGRGEAGLTDQVHLLLDLLDVYLGQLFESERLDRLPLDWTTMEHQGARVQVRGELRNPQAEQAARAWLERFGDEHDTDD